MSKEKEKKHDPTSKRIFFDFFSSLTIPTKKTKKKNPPRLPVSFNQQLIVRKDT